MPSSDPEKTHTEFLENASPDTTEAPSLTEDSLHIQRRLLLKYDLVILPCVTMLYLSSFIDRSNIGNAKVAGLEKDLKLVGYQFNIALTAFFISYAFIEVPSNLVLKHVGPKLWLSGLTIAFGVVCLGTAFVKRFEDLVTVRFLLGLTEGGIMPGIAYMLSRFYRRDELYLRIGFFLSAGAVSGAFGGLLAYGFVQIPAFGPLHTWRHIFFFEGIITILVGLVIGCFLPNSPNTFAWLTDEEKALALRRLREVEMKRKEPAKITKRDLKVSFGSIFTAFACLGMACVNCMVQSLALFMPTIIHQLGYTSLRANLFTVPPYAVAAVLCVVLSFISDKIRRRGVILMCIFPLAIAGFSIEFALEKQPGVRYFGIFLATCGAFPAAPGFLTWGTNNTLGDVPAAITTAMIVAVSTFGAMVAAWSYLPKDSPRYQPGHALNIGAASMAFAIAVELIVYVRWENKQRAAGKRNHNLRTVTPEEEGILGRKHPSFRYIE